MRYLMIFLVLVCTGCGNNQALPPVPPAKIDNAVEAKQQARTIASQKCQYIGYKDLGIDDYGAQKFECDHGQYILELGQSHIFEREFFDWKVGDEAKFRYSDKLLMKPVYVGNARPQETNPAYYLEPVR